MNTHKKIIVLLLLSGCSPIIEHRGYDFEKIDKIVPNIDNVEDVQRKLGSPTYTSTFSIEDGGIWYYVSQTVKQTSFFKPKVEKQKALKIYFSKDGVVKKIDTSDNVGKSIEISKKDTKVLGYNEGPFRDIFGRFGKKTSKN